MRTAGTDEHKLKCTICGERITAKDKFAIYAQMRNLHSGELNGAYICGDCYYNKDICEAWGDGETEQLQAVLRPMTNSEILEAIRRANEDD